MIRSAALLLVLSQPAAAQGGGSPAEQARAVYDSLQLSAVVEVMAQEGVEYGGVLAESLFTAGPVPATWTDAVADIYDAEAMAAAVLSSLEATLAGEDVGAMLAFLETEQAQALVGLEVSARRVMIDDDVEEAAKEAAAVALAEEAPRVDLVRRYAEANDLIETNVVGALNTNYAYFMGLMDGGAMGSDTSEGDILADVSSQEPQIRADTTEWVYAFLLLAYGPAPDADIEALIDFSDSEAGQALNRAVFAAFDGLFGDISHGLGLTAARYMTTQEI